MSFHFIFVTNFIRDKNPLYGIVIIFVNVHVIKLANEINVVLLISLASEDCESKILNI